MRDYFWRVVPIVIGGGILLAFLLTTPFGAVTAAPPLSITETGTAEPPTRTPVTTTPTTGVGTTTPTTSVGTTTPTTSVGTTTPTVVVPPTSTPTSPPVVPPTSTPTSPPVVPPTSTPTSPPPDAPGSSPDLVLSKSVSPGVAQVGDQVVYTLTLSNIGGAAASEVVVDDPLPAFLRLVNVSASSGTVQTVGNQVTVSIPVLAPGESVTITIQAELIAAPLPPDNRNVASARTSSSEITTDNNTSSATLLPALPDLIVTKEVNPAIAQVGDNVVYTITVQNIGGAPASDVTLSDNLPPVLRLIGATTTVGDVQTNGNQVTVTAPTLAPGDIIVVQVTAQVTAPLTSANSLNTATVRTSGGEITTDNNTGSVTLGSPPASLPQTAGDVSRSLLILMGLALLTIGIGAFVRRRSYR